MAHVTRAMTSVPDGEDAFPGKGRPRDGASMEHMSLRHAPRSTPVIRRLWTCLGDTLCGEHE